MGCGPSTPKETTALLDEPKTSMALAGSSHHSRTPEPNSVAIPSKVLKPSKKKKKSNGSSKKQQQQGTELRPRADSWAINGSHPQQHLQSSPSPLEQQWELLWEKQSKYLLDPADVHAVLDALQSRQVNLLSATQVTLIQRKVRSIVKSLGSSTTTKSTMRVFGSSSAYGSNAVAETEARFVADKNHLLHPYVVLRVLRPCVVQAPKAAVQQGVIEYDTVDVIENAVTLLLHLAEPLWDRVADIALHTAELAELEMDVNKTDAQNQRPKPSLVPDVAQAPEPPDGISLQALCFIIALAVKGSRNQRLQLLFYLLMDNEQLRTFLYQHPAGGVPIWLLEVGHSAVVSLASLTHYHYYGTAFLPKEVEIGPFVASKSPGREPVTVSSAIVLAAVESLVWPPPPDAPGTPATTATTPSKEKGGSNSSSRRNSSSAANILKRRSSEKLEAMAPSDASSVDTGVISRSELQKKLQDVADSNKSDYEDQLLLKSRKKFEAASSKHTNKPLWTLEDFCLWAKDGLDNTALDALMHRIFGSGILPSHSTERELVQLKWEEWQQSIDTLLTQNEPDSTLEMLTKSVQQLLTHSTNSNGDVSVSSARASAVWGGIGGIDGGGGIGHGVLHCVDKQWWDAWAAYVGWSWVGERPAKRGTLKRPGSLSTERLLDRDPDTPVIPGTLGSYELMKHGLKRNTDYILVPPGVWDTLFEMYGGGPPLPRMVKPHERKFSDANRISTDASDNNNGDLDDIDTVMGSFDEGQGFRVFKLPESLSVATHPWVVTVHLCDPQQPYRRGDAGSVSIRVMATPDQPLWRLYTEVITRFPLTTYKAFDEGRRGKARLWKRIEPSAGKEPVSRYGPWNLLCKSRHAILPLLINGSEIKDQYKELTENWKGYTDDATVESIGLSDQDHIMLEFAVLNKSGELKWPREAAAKAGRVRRLAEEDMQFRRTMQGVDEKGNMLLKAPKIVGMEVDAMDATGRWYPVTILEVDIMDDDTDEEPFDEDEDASGDEARQKGIAHKKVRVDFQEYGGHIEWIDVESDRLAMAGRFTSETEKQSSIVDAPANNGSGNSVSGDSKMKPPAPIKKGSNAESTMETGKICQLPGYGACGLTNLGNTCYVNSAIQCISYLPLLRAYLLSYQYKTTGDLNKDNPLGTGGKLLEEFADLLRVMWSARYGEKSPSRFRGQLAKVNSQFSGADQQDAQEFLNFMLDVLHEDSNKVRKKPYVEALEDDWVKKTALPRVGDEAWRRFLRRNRSVMSDVAMGQVLNTVTCPVCKFSSRNFDPFNLLSIPIPTVADVVFQCTVIRRATYLNCPKTLNRPRNKDKRVSRFPRKLSNSESGPPSDRFIVEQYGIAMSRLADSSDLKIQIQNICGIPANQLRVCRAEEVIVNSDAADDSVVKTQTKVIPLTDKEGPCSQLAKKRTQAETIAGAPTRIIAFESTLRPRAMASGPASEDGETDDTADEEEDDGQDEDDRELPTLKEQAEIKRYIDVYGDDKECRLVDTDSFVIAKAVSRSLWPRSEDEMKIGLRVDAKDHRGNWFPGSVVEVFEDTAEGGAAEEMSIMTKKVKVHFDNFSTKWDELYEIEHFREGRIRPVYAHAQPRAKPTEFPVYHRYVGRESGRTFQFGQSFFVQCQNDWSNARAGAHILAQASRFLPQGMGSSGPVDVDDAAASEREMKVNKQYEKIHAVISDLIDVLVGGDKEYARLALGVSDYNNDAEKARPYRNPSFDVTTLSDALDRKVSKLLHQLPFEIYVVTVDSTEKVAPNSEEFLFPLSLVKTIGNFMNARNAVFLQWRDPAMDKKSSSGSSPSKNLLGAPVVYVAPAVTVDDASAAILKNSTDAAHHHGKKNRPGSAGLNLGVCLSEFCKVNKLSLDDNWRCPRCKEFREGRQRMSLWRLPDQLVFHIKRFNMSARWREKITTKVKFPLTGLDMSEWCHKESPTRLIDSDDSHVYDLIGVVNHYGSMTGGHYVATCKATSCGRDGREEVAYDFSGAGANSVDIEDVDEPSGWRIGRSKAESNQSKIAAAMAAKSVSESAEPLWLQFDDELVEPIPPRQVVSECAYVLFYRRRRMTPANLAKYSTLE